MPGWGSSVACLPRHAAQWRDRALLGLVHLCLQDSRWQNCTRAFAALCRAPLHYVCGCEQPLCFALPIVPAGPLCARR